MRSYSGPKEGWREVQFPNIAVSAASLTYCHLLALAIMLLLLCLYFSAANGDVFFCSIEEAIVKTGNCKSLVESYGSLGMEGASEECDCPTGIQSIRITGNSTTCQWSLSVTRCSGCENITEFTCFVLDSQELDNQEQDDTPWISISFGLTAGVLFLLLIVTCCCCCLYSGTMRSSKLVSCLRSRV